MTAREKEFEAFLDCEILSDDFFIEIIEKKLKIQRDKFKLRLVLIRSAAASNENYNAQIYRAKIKVKLLENEENTNVDVIIKALLKTEYSAAFSYFDREKLLYENVLGSFEKLWLERANEVVEFGPQCYKFESTPYEVIVMEDLKASHYEMLDRKMGCTLPQAKSLLSKLAKFHAASAVRYCKEGIIHQCLDRNNSAPKNPEEGPFAHTFKRLHVALQDALKSYGDCDEYLEKISSWNIKKIFNFWIDSGKPMKCGFINLCHGDLWINNVMFKENEVKMFDFQATAWASPAYDIFYFLLTSISDEVKVENFDNLIEFYHQQLNEGLIKLGYEQHIPSLSEIHEDLMDKGTFSIVCILFLLFIFKYDSNEELNLQMIMGEVNDAEELEKMYVRIYRNETYKKAIKTWLPFLNERGFLDCMLD